MQNLSDSQLKFSYWYVTNKLILRKWLIALMILISTLFWLFIVWQMVFYAIDGTFEKRNIQSIISDGSSWQAVNNFAPKPLKITDAKAISDGNSKYDLISGLSNPNSDWLATFNYQFISSDTTYKYDGFILPGQEKYLMDLGLDSPVANLQIINLDWTRVEEFEPIYNQRYQFEISNEEFTAGAKAGDPNVLSFDITNHSAYSYWSVGIQAFLYAGSNITSANYIAVEQLKAGETRTVNLHWNNQLPRINDLEIIADVNILDQDNIIPPESPVGDPR